MPESPTPRQILKGLVNGIRPQRPLFVPSVFSLGARVENQSLLAFLNNPTKICSSLRLIQNSLRSDGVFCYQYPFLEVEALGATPEWEAHSMGPVLRWAHPAVKRELPQGLCSPEEAAKNGRVPVACEVIRRMNVLKPRAYALAAAVSGPFTLAARITQLEESTKLTRNDFPEAALELASSTITQIATAFLDAGAEIILIQEDVLPALTSEICDAWAALLAATVNVVRFYEALPVLRIANRQPSATDWGAILRQQWNCVICLPLDRIGSLASEVILHHDDAMLGLAWPLAAFGEGESSSRNLRQVLPPLISDLRPVLLTTVADVPATADMKKVMRVLEEVRSSLTIPM